MKARNIVKTTACVILLGALALTGCTSYQSRTAYVPASRGELTTEYYYYPNSEVYYDPTRQVYFWQRNGTWESGSNIPSDIVLDQSNHVVVFLDTRTPY